MQMNTGLIAAVSMLGLAGIGEAAVSNWALQPKASQKAGGKVRIEFAVPAPTDVELAILDGKGTVVRHLAAGVLGATNAPPAPLKPGLAQSLEWNGKDDYGADAKGRPFSVRVRAGMGVKLEQIAGGDPYMYLGSNGHSDHGPWGINGLEVKSDGKVYVLGHSSNLGPPALRQYDADGSYLQTLFPPPAGKDVDGMKAWGLNVRADGSYTPKFNRLTDPSLAMTILDRGTGGMGRLFPTPEPGRLSLWSTDARSLSMMTLNSDGTIPEPAGQMQGPLVKSPALPIEVKAHAPASVLWGPVFTCPTPDGKHFYLSGAFEAKQLYGVFKGPVRGGFWRDGQVWKVDLETRTARPFFVLDEETVVKAKNIDHRFGQAAALHGVAVDKDENVFVCDRVNQRVVALDKSGRVIREIPVADPDAIAVSSRTGALYVTARAAKIRLLKFNDWRKDNEPAVSLEVSEGRSRMPRPYEPSHVVVCEKEKSSNVWVAHTLMPVRIYRDDGNGLALLKDFHNREEVQRASGFDRLEVDQKTGDAYILDNHGEVYRVGDWSNPRFVKVPISADGLAIDARNRHVYAKGWGGKSWGTSTGGGGLSRFHLDQEAYPAANLGATGSNRFTGPIWNEWCFTGLGCMGFAVAPNGNLAALDQRGNLLFYQGSQEKAPWDSTVLAKSGLRAAGVQFDFEGNLYVGYVDKAPSKKNIPPGFETDRFARSCGRIHKYAPTGALASGNLFPTPPVGPVKTYDVLYGGFDVDTIVRGPRFSVDGFGRIYYPLNIEPRVSVMDNAGNGILHFGTYGNRDSMGGLPGDMVPTQDIPLGFPNSVGATDDYIYVADMVNLRLLRIAKTFAAAETVEIGNERKEEP